MPESDGFEFRKPISTYICSTPLDFTEEREHLSSHIFPQLNELCKSRGSYFSPVDLRWTPGDQKTEGGQLLKTQLDCIKKCSPFFICLLGETYGPYRSENDPPLVNPRNGRGIKIPEDCDWLDKNLLLAGSGGHPWILQEGHQTSSITELEVTQGAFLCDNQHATLYYRQAEHLDLKLQDLGGPENEDARNDIIACYSSESDHARIKILDLRQRVVNKGVPVKYFTTVEELGQLVLDDWLEIIDIVLPPLMHDARYLDTLNYSEWLSQESFNIRRSSVFVSVPDIDETLQHLTEFAMTSTRGETKADGEDFFITEKGGSGSQVRGYSATSWFRKRPVSSTNSTSIMLLTGDRGVGKSALAARWLNEFKAENPHIAVVSHFVSASHNSADIISFLHQSVSKLRRQYLLSDSYKAKSICAEIEREYDQNDQSFSSLCEAFLAAVGLGPCVILLDGLNELGAAHGLSIQEVKEFSWLPENLPPTCKIIFTTTRSDISHRCLSQRQDVCVVKCPAGLTDVTSTVEMVKEHVPGIKQLVGGENAVKKLGNLKIMQTALGSRVVGSEVKCFRVYSDMAKFMESCAEIWSLRNFWVLCVQNWVQDHSWALDEPSSEINFVDSGFDYSGWVVDSLCLIAVSRNGLTQSQILSMLEMIGYIDDLRVSSYDWLQFRLAAGSTLSENGDGRIVFGHKYLQEIAEYLFFKTMSSFSFDPATILKFSRYGIRQIYHEHLARFFSQQSLNTQVLEELPWQLMLSGDTSGLLDYLTDCGALLKMLSEDGDRWHQDLKLYWSVCELSGHHPGTVYLQLTHSLAVVDVNDVEGLEDNYCHSEMISPTPRVIVSTPQPESHYENEEGTFYRSSSPQTDEIFEPMKRKVSEDLGPTDFVSGVFVTQGGQRSSLQAGQAKGINKDNFPGVASLSWYIGSFLQKLGETEACRILFTSLIKYIKRNYPLTFEQQVLLCQCHHGVGKTSEGSGDLVTAEREYRAALHALVAADDMDEDLEHQEDIQYLRGLLLSCHGRIRTRGEDLFDSEELLKEALECVEDNLNCFVLKSEIYYNLGLLRSSQGDYPRAESCLRESVKLRCQWFGRCHSLVADALVALGKLLALPNNTKGRDVIQAENLFRQALSIQEKCLGISNLTVACVLFDLGELLSEEQSHPAKMEAQKFLRRSLDIRTTELGGNHPLTQHTQQSLTRLDVALKMGQYEFGPAKSSGRRSNNSPFSALTLRESDLVRLQNRVNSSMKVDEPLMVRAVSKDEVIRHNRPDSIISSVMSFTSASERLLSAPISERPRLLRREKENPSRQSIHPQRYGSISEDAAGKNEDVVIVDSLDSKGRRLTVGADNYPESDFSDVVRNDLDNQKDEGLDEPRDDDLNPGVERERTISVDFHDKGESKDGDLDIYSDENPMLDSYAQDGMYTGEKKSVRLRPSSAPRRMFERFGNGNGVAKRAKSSSKLGSANSANRNWSGRSNITTASSVISGHHSRHPLPGPHDITVSNTRSVSGPHSSLASLLGESPCPRPSSNEIHHRSAWYHIPGRYVTPQEWYPRKRMQKTENAKDISAFMTLKSNWAKNRQKELQQAKFREQKEQEALLSKTKPTKNILTNSKSSVASTNSLGRAPAYNRLGGRQKLINRKDSTPRLMISGLDMVPETRYAAGNNYSSSQSQTVKFKEPIVVG